MDDRLPFRRYCYTFTNSIPQREPFLLFPTRTYASDFTYVHETALIRTRKLTYTYMKAGIYVCCVFLLNARSEGKRTSLSYEIIHK